MRSELSLMRNMSNVASWVPLALATALLASSAWAGVPNFAKTEDELSFQLVLEHPAPAMPPHVHVLPGDPAVDWATPLRLATYLVDGVQSAVVTWNPEAQHLAFPHETGPGPVWNHLWWVSGVPGGGPRTAPCAVRLPHGDHVDAMTGTLTVWSNAAGAVGFIHFTAVGVHDDSADPAKKPKPQGGAGSGSQVVPPTYTDAVCSVAAIVSEYNSTITLSILVSGIPGANLIAADIALGAPGENGPPIFDLGGPAEWEDLGDGSLARMVATTPFPPAYLGDLLAGNTYIELRTVAYPDGEIRGQLEPVPSVLWDTGAPHAVMYNGNPNYLGYSSGNLPAMPQRWAAVPFSIPPAGAVISRIDADWFVSPGYEAETTNYIVWQRTGLTPPQPGDEVATGVLGPYAPGIDDPRTPDMDDWLHIYDGLNIALPGGDYYFTLYAHGIGQGNTTGFSDGPWLTGGDLQDETLEQPFMWRSATFPQPGFEPYDNPAIQQLPDQDPDDRWNPCFRIYGLVNSMMGTPGDLNCDGTVGFGDINPFVLYLSNFATWLTTYPDCPPENGDINGDGVFPSFGDINPFVALLTGS